MGYGKSTESSAISCNVSWKREINAETLVGILSGKTPPDNWQPHLETFFNELPKALIRGVMEENGLSLDQLARVFETLPAVFQEKSFKELIQHG